MKYPFVFSCCLLSLFSISCSQASKGGALKQAYVHKYGVPIAKETWESRGRSGQIITTQRDGSVITENFQAGLLQGTATYTFPHSKKIARTETYDKGSLIASTTNYKSGLPKREEKYLSPAHFVVTQWYESGVPQMVEEYQEGLLQTGEYFTTEHEQEAQVTKGTGKRVRRDAFGLLLSKDTISEGLLTLRSTVYSDGDPHELIPFVANQVHGEKKVFARGGVPLSLENWSMGTQEGLTVLYENGIKSAEITYRGGKRHGIEKRFRDGKFLAEEVSWEEGHKHGPRKIYIDGEIQTDWYFRDQLVNRSTFQRKNRG